MAWSTGPSHGAGLVPWVGSVPWASEGQLGEELPHVDRVVSVHPEAESIRRTMNAAVMRSAHVIRCVNWRCIVISHLAATGRPSGESI